MNPHQTCGTCIHNEASRCACEASRYNGSPVKSWNTCSAHEAPMPPTAALIERLTTCAWGLDHLAAKAEYKAYFADRARQCRKWLADLKEEGDHVNAEYITGGLKEFEAIAL